MHQAIIRSVIVLTVSLLVAAQAHALEVHDPRTPEPPHGAPVLAGYMVLENPGDETVYVTGANSPDFARVSLHETVVEDDTARMQSVEAFEVPAHGRVELAPGGKHLMLYEPERHVEAGDVLRVTLDTSIGPVEASLQVVHRDDVDRSHQEHGEHDHH